MGCKCQANSLRSPISAKRTRCSVCYLQMALESQHRKLYRRHTFHWANSGPSTQRHSWLYPSRIVESWSSSCLRWTSVQTWNPDFLCARCLCQRQFFDAGLWSCGGHCWFCYPSAKSLNRHQACWLECQLLGIKCALVTSVNESLFCSDSNDQSWLLNLTPFSAQTFHPMRHFSWHIFSHSFESQIFKRSYRKRRHPQPLAKSVKSTWLHLLFRQRFQRTATDCHHRHLPQCANDALSLESANCQTKTHWHC